MKKHIISVKVENKFGVLARVSGLFSARGYNIDSLAVSETELENVSVMTIVVHGDDKIIEQVKKQLNKLIDVIKITDHTSTQAIQRELAIIKVNAVPSKRPEILQLAEVFHAEISDISPKSIIFAVKGDPDKIDSLIELMSSYGIKEMMRTGRLSILKD
jgi:acetolactate synthase-1/3 small subunit